MNILAITDLHGKPVDKLLGLKDIGLVLILGDITTGANLDDTIERIQPLRDAYPLLFAIPGNWDRIQSQQWLIDEGIGFDEKPIAVGDTVIYGIGGSLATPFNTPNEITEQDISNKLAGCPQKQDGERLIVCSHNPPHGACDKAFVGGHVGSKTLKGFIEGRKPDLVLCGHIHEARGMEMIGSTPVVNPGTAPRHYALIEIAENISIQLH